MSLKEIRIKTTFTYDAEKDEIGWFCPEAHKGDIPKIHTTKRDRYGYCVGRAGFKCSVSTIKNVLGGTK